MIFRYYLHSTLTTVSRDPYYASFIDEETGSDMNSQCKLLILHKTSQGQRLCLFLCYSYTTCLWKVYPSVLSGTLMDRPLKLHQEVQRTWPRIYMRLTLGAHHTVSWERSQEVLVWSCPQKNQLPRQTLAALVSWARGKGNWTGKQSSGAPVLDGLGLPRCPDDSRILMWL